MAYKLKATKKGDNIVIHKDSFEMILISLANQKLGIGCVNADALAGGKKAYDKSQKEMQEFIDDIYRQCETILYK